jgi:hypothetical protein
MENRGKNRDSFPKRGRDSGWFRGESSRGKTRGARSLSPPPSHISPLPDEKRAMRMLWQSKISKPYVTVKMPSLKPLTVKPLTKMLPM